MSADHESHGILSLTAGAQLREVLTANRAELMALLERHAAEARALGLADTASRARLEAMVAEIDAQIAESLALTEEVYQRCPHLRPENTPDE